MGRFNSVKFRPPRPACCRAWCLVALASNSGVLAATSTEFGKSDVYVSSSWTATSCVCYGWPQRAGFSPAICCCTSSSCTSRGVSRRSCSCGRTRGNFHSHLVNFAFRGVGFTFVGFSNACLGLRPSPVSLFFVALLHPLVLVVLESV